jgi:hypothetical protein
MMPWEPDRRPVESLRLGRTELAPGDHVRLRPQRRADIMDSVLRGKTATIAAIEQDYEGRIHVAVTVDEDPGQDIGQAGKIAHRFFFGIEEIEPLTGDEQTSTGGADE